MASPGGKGNKTSIKRKIFDCEVEGCREVFCGIMCILAKNPLKLCIKSEVQSITNLERSLSELK